MSSRHTLSRTAVATRWFVVTLAAAGLVGCGSSGEDTGSRAAEPASSSSSAPPPRAGAVATTQTAEQTVADDPADELCPGEYRTEQFIGEWTEEGSPAVTSLGPQGALQSEIDGKREFGTWQLLPWDDSPAKDQRPPTAPNSCVLWLQWLGDAQPQDLVYAPLSVGADRIELSYVGRGNTLVWLRATGAR